MHIVRVRNEPAQGLDLLKTLKLEVVLHAFLRGVVRHPEEGFLHYLDLRYGQANAHEGVEHYGKLLTIGAFDRRFELPMHEVHDD